MEKFGAFWNGVNYSIIKVLIEDGEPEDVEVLLCTDMEEGAWMDWGTWVYSLEDLGELHDTLDEAVTPDVMDFLQKNHQNYTCGSIKGFPFTRKL